MSDRRAGYYLLKKVRGFAQRSTDENLSGAFMELDEYMKDGGLLPEQWEPTAPKPGRPVLGPGQILEGVPHGVYGSYRKGCRCTRCRQCNTMRASEYRERQREREEEGQS